MIGFFVISTHLGGAEKSLLELLIDLKKYKNPSLIFVPKAEGPLVEKLQSHGFQVQSLKIPQWYLRVSRSKKLYTLFLLPALALYSFFLFFQIRHWVRSHSLTTIHSTGLKFHILLGCMAPLMKQTDFILHIRDMIHNPRLRCFFSWMARNPNLKLIANSKQTQISLEPAPSELVYNGFPPPKPQSTTIKTVLDLPPLTPLIGLVAVIARWKGQREFIEMASLLLETHPDCHFVIVGSEIYDTRSETGELKYLKQMVTQSPHESHIHFLPFQSNIDSVYQGLDILVHSSIRPEPFGRVVVEAMLNGVPVTASNQGGPMEIIEDGENGLLHIQGDVQSMAENVKKMMDNKNLRDHIKYQARLRGQAFSMEQHSKKMAKALGLLNS